ncbi:hypothetical protein AB4Z22_35355, partial [Paenibacillus sp. TAF58]
IKPDEMAKLQQYLAHHYQIKLTGIVGTNKITGWNEEEIRKLDSGEITYPSYMKTRKKPALNNHMK